MSKPSRSEEGSSAEESAAFHAQAEDFFKSTAPKHAPKPPRSEVPEGEDPSAFVPAGDVNDAERRHLTELNQSTEPVVPLSTPDSTEEYLPTEYYGTVSTGHKHCPTGEAFIKLDVKQACPVNVSSEHHLDAHAFVQSEHLTNPARDDWNRAPKHVVS